VSENGEAEERFVDFDGRVFVIHQLSNPPGPVLRNDPPQHARSYGSGSRVRATHQFFTLVIWCLSRTLQDSAESSESRDSVFTRSRPARSWSRLSGRRA
jgi:hypothetical protein